jgi:hypothetical protein
VGERKYSHDNRVLGTRTNVRKGVEKKDRRELKKREERYRRKKIYPEKDGR